LRRSKRLAAGYVTKIKKAGRVPGSRHNRAAFGLAQVFGTVQEAAQEAELAHVDAETRAR
jgi:hypothetical protein